MTSTNRIGSPRPAKVIDLIETDSNKTSSVAKRSFSEAFPRSQVIPRIGNHLDIQFLHGTEDHVGAYTECIDDAESDIIIASWNLNFIPQEIFTSLMNAKERGVGISFIVESIKREETLQYFEDDDSDYSFRCFETNSHAKFLLVDSQALILGSYNALGDAKEESLDASILIQGTKEQLWPFYMSIYETYLESDKELAQEVFGSIASISRARHARERPLLQRSLKDGSQIFLLRTIKEHEDFFKEAAPHNGHITIYSPFSTKDNSLKRLKTLDQIIPAATKVSLKVLPQFKNGLTRQLNQVPGLQIRATVEPADSHQKVAVFGTSTLCIGSFNWLSAAQDSTDFYSNVEFSIVLLGPQAQAIIEEFYTS